jgi:hypothetical protein
MVIDEHKRFGQHLFLLSVFLIQSELIPISMMPKVCGTEICQDWYYLVFPIPRVLSTIQNQYNGGTSIILY